MRNEIKRLIVTLRALVPGPDLAAEDQALSGTWGLSLTGRLLGRDDAENVALDVFHRVVPIRRLEDFEIAVRVADPSEPVGEELGPFSQVPNPPFADRLLEEAFGVAFRQVRPDTPAEAIVYAVDAGEPDDLNTRMDAAVFDRDILDPVRMIGEPIRISVDKGWLSEVLNGAAEQGPSGP